MPAGVHRTVTCCFLFIVTLTGSACGVFNQCSNKCPSGFKHDVFCGCYKPDEKKSVGVAQPTALNPEWVCPAKDNPAEYESWEPDSGFGSDMYSLKGKTVRFASHSCKVNAIPFLLQAANCQADADGDPLCVTPGSRSVMTVKTVVRRTNLINGAVAWGVRGTITENVNAALLPGPASAPTLFERAVSGLDNIVTDVTSRLATSAELVTAKPQRMSLSARNAQAPMDCSDHCQREDEFCAVASVNRIDGARWQQILNQISVKPTRIAKRDLMAAASTDRDACSRNDLSVARDGRFSNQGDSCKMEIPFEDGSATVSLPEKVAGGLSMQADGSIGVIFASVKESPAVDFSDKELHDEFGGLVTGMNLAARSLTVSTSSGKCIQLRR